MVTEKGMGTISVSSFEPKARNHSIPSGTSKGFPKWPHSGCKANIQGAEGDSRFAFKF